MRGRVEDVVSKVASGFGCTGSVDWRLDEQPLYPPVVNDPATAKFTGEVAEELFPGQVDTSVETLMAGEDFGFFCHKAPCTFAFIGIRNETAGSVHNLHQPRFTMDESVLYKGTALHTAWALSYLRKHAVSDGGKTEL
ncbi:hypothetical protein FOA52_008926 [Chlamydomonas sp. UWO 241]|nr:hypothetical protein FOA52_008926 [Chlamydomonas sp. UWO 241]